MFHTIIKLDKIDSTNAYALELAKHKNIKETIVISAKFQSQGQGQMGSQWESNYAENILFSVICYPDLILTDQFSFNMAVSLALFDFLQLYFSEKVKIKWPNDLLVDNKKIGGILIQNIVSGNKIKHSILGVGMNINQLQFKDYIPKANSFRLITGIQYDTDYLLDKMLNCLAKRILQLNHKALNEEYVSNLFALNEWRNYRISNSEINAKIIGVDNIGRLILVTKEGKEMCFSLKEIAYVF